MLFKVIRIIIEISVAVMLIGLPFIIAVYIRTCLTGAVFDATEPMSCIVPQAVGILKDLPFSAIFVPFINKFRFIEAVSISPEYSFAVEMVKGLVCAAIFSLFSRLFNSLRTPIYNFKLSIFKTFLLVLANFTVLLLISILASAMFRQMEMLNGSLNLLIVSSSGVLSLTAMVTILNVKIKIKVKIAAKLAHVLIEGILKYILKMTCIICIMVCFIKEMEAISAENPYNQPIIYVIIIFVIKMIMNLIDKLCLKKQVAFFDTSTKNKSSLIPFNHKT